MAEENNTNEFFEKMTESFSSAISDSTLNKGITNLGNKLNSIYERQDKSKKSIQGSVQTVNKNLKSNLKEISTKLTNINKSITGLYKVIEGIGKNITIVSGGGSTTVTRSRSSKGSIIQSSKAIEKEIDKEMAELQKLMLFSGLVSFKARKKELKNLYKQQQLTKPQTYDRLAEKEKSLNLLREYQWKVPNLNTIDPRTGLTYGQLYEVHKNVKSTNYDYQKYSKPSEMSLGSYWVSSNPFHESESDLKNPSLALFNQAQKDYDTLQQIKKEEEERAIYYGGKGKKGTIDFIAEHAKWAKRAKGDRTSLSTGTHSKPGEILAWYLENKTKKSRENLFSAISGANTTDILSNMRKFGLQAQLEKIKDSVASFKELTGVLNRTYKGKILDERERSNVELLIETISEFRETLGSEYKPQSRQLNELIGKLDDIINKSDEKKASQQGNNKNQSTLANAILSFLPGGGGINNIFRMVGKMHPLLAGLFVVLGGILGGINKIIPIMELFNDIMAVAFIKSVMGFQDLASFFKGANITEGTNGAKSARQSSREATQKQQQEMANAEIAQRIGTVSVNGKKMSIYDFHGQQVVSAHSLNLHGMVAQGKAQYVPLKNIGKLMEYDEYMFQKGLTPVYTSFMGGTHTIGSDVSRSHWGGGKLDKQIFKNGKSIRMPKEVESAIARAGGIGNGALGWEAPGTYDNKQGVYDIGYGNIRQGSLIQGYKAPVIKSEYDKGFEDWNARQKQKELEQKQKELDNEKEKKTVDITGGTQSDIIRSAINTMPYLDSDSPTMSDSVKNSIMGVQNSFGIFGI